MNENAPHHNEAPTKQSFDQLTSICSDNCLEEVDIDDVTFEPTTAEQVPK